MRKIVSLILLTLAAFSFEAMAATPKDDVLEAIRTYRAALVKKDIAALEKIWATDYVFVDGRGKIVTRETRLAELKSGHSSIGSIKHEDEATVTVHGTTVLVLSRVTIVGKYSGHEVSNEFRSLHVWTNAGGHWQLLFNQLTPIQ